MSQNSFKKQKFAKITCIDYLNSFKQTELLDFKNLVSCSYFNTDKSVILLLDILMQKVLGKKAFDSEMQLIVYEVIFECKVQIKNLNQKHKRRLHNKFNILTRLIEKFLVLDGIKDQKAYCEDILLKKIKEKKLFNIFERKIGKSKKTLNNTTVKDSEHYYHNFIREQNTLDYQFEESIIYDNKNYELNDLNYHLDLFYILNKLKINLSILTLEETSIKKFDVSTINALTPLFNLPQYKNHACIKVYQTAIRLLKKQSEKTYLLLRKLLIEKEPLFPKNEIVVFYDLLAHFCVDQIKKGVFKHRELFLLFKTMDQQDLVVKDDFLSEVKLKNMVAIACKTGETIWAVNLVEKYIDFIRKDIRNSVYHLNLGVTKYYQKNYDKALNHVIKVDDVNKNYNKSCRILILKCHYELDKEYDYRTERIYRSAEKYFKSNKLFNKIEKKMYANFMNIFINLYKIKHNAGKNTLELIKKRLETQDINSDKHWLFAKIEELVLLK